MAQIQQTATALSDERGSGRSPERFDIRSIPTPTVFTHLVTLVNRRTEQEATFPVETLSDRFVDVLHEVAHQKAVRGLFGYEIFEAISLDCPF